MQFHLRSFNKIFKLKENFKFEMSRIIVKNLPKYYTRDEFKQLFESQGTVTDAKIMFTKDGINRRFGYIGFKNESDAQKALEYFNNSFIDTCRITVDIAKPFTDTSDLKTWSKYSKVQDIAPPQEKEDLVQKEKMEMLKFLYSEETDDKLLEFLQVNNSKGSGQRKTWDNDFNQKITVAAKKIEDPIEQDYQDLSQKKKEDETEQEAEQDSIKFDENVSDLEYLKSKIKIKSETNLVTGSDETHIHPSRLQKLTKEEITQDSAVEIDSPVENFTLQEVQENDSADQIKEDSLSLIGDTGRLFVRNLPFSTTEEELKEFFEKFGDLTEVHLPIYKDTKYQKGYAFIQFMLPEHAVTAYAKCHGEIFQGRILDILPGKEKISDNLSISATDSFQVQKEKQKKKVANQDFNWNSLFMNV